MAILTLVKKHAKINWLYLEMDKDSLIKLIFRIRFVFGK